MTSHVLKIGYARGLRASSSLAYGKPFALRGVNSSDKRLFHFSIWYRYLSYINHAGLAGKDDTGVLYPHIFSYVFSTEYG